MLPRPTPMFLAAHQALNLVLVFSCADRNDRSSSLGGEGPI